MYPGHHARNNPDRICGVMATSGEQITYAEFERRSNRLAHLLHDRGLRFNDHYSIFLENTLRYLECCGAGHRSGLHYTPVNSFLTAREVAYIVTNSTSQAFITSRQQRAVAVEAAPLCTGVTTFLMFGANEARAAGEDVGPFEDFDEVVGAYPTTPLEEQFLGSAMLYSSGTTGNPKGILRTLPGTSPDDELHVHQFMGQLWGFFEGMVYLSPAPLYHAAPQSSVATTLQYGGTVVIMEKFDAEQYLQLVERYRVTHSQLVPTMFVRMLKLPEDVRSRYDVSSMHVALHGAAPCPVKVKQQMIEWWGPILREVYGSTEGIGCTAVDSAEWLRKPGTVGTVRYGALHVLDEDMQPCAPNQTGVIWFEAPDGLQYFNDPERTAAAQSPDGALSTVGDIGYLDEDGYLFLTDRQSFLIISGGVNISPQECEDLLIVHPKVEDAAVIGVPNDDLGEEVKAVVQLVGGVEPTNDVAAELMAYCRANLAAHKCPRSIDFDAHLPRLPTGKLYKRLLVDRYRAAADAARA